jgi:radical SAM family uncharacterized protein
MTHTAGTQEQWLEAILAKVRKPGRYLGNEWNAVKKNFSAQGLRFAICFPNLYEIGMSNLGLRIIYGLLNEQEGVSCERVFLPDTDMREILKQEKVPLFSLESKTALREFDFIGFCLSYELDYANVLEVLELSGIPLLAKDRSPDFPLIIAGGSCVSNPEPLSDFIDLFLIGEAEEALLEIVERYRKLRAEGRGRQVSKEEMLREIAKVGGVYVPSLYEPEYNENNSLKSFSAKYADTPPVINKRIVKDLNRAYYPTRWLVPYVSIVHDRASVELMRGCPHRCNFCQARSLYYSLRMRSPERALELARSIIQSSGYEEISLLSLSTSDYPFLSKIICALSDTFQKEAIAISLPSLRPKSYLGDLADYLSRVRKTTFTFAPEAGSERLRESINKNFKMDEFYTAVLSAYKAGWQSVKLYFMIGLPREEYEDLDGILEIVREVSRMRKDVSRSAAQVRASISFFVPKPHTAFEREAMDSEANLRAKIAYLRKKASGLPRQIELNFHDLESSLLEAVFSRGGRHLGKVLLSAYRKGCPPAEQPARLRHMFWQETFKECSETQEAYLRKRGQDEILPWQHIDLADMSLTKDTVKSIV